MSLLMCCARPIFKTCLLPTCAGAKVSAIVDAISALRAKLGGGAESPIVTKSGGAGIVRTYPLLLLAIACSVCQHFATNGDGVPDVQRSYIRA